MRGPILDLLSYFTGGETLPGVILSFFSVFVILFLVFPFRAYARGWVAKQLGDDTPERSGMLTLNPLAHIDPMGALCMCICCIGWSKPVPISVNRCRKVSQSTAVVLTSATGPVALLLLAFIMMIISKVVLVASAADAAYYIYAGLSYAAQISAYLAVLNLIPVPPFDGYYIIAGLLPRKAAIWMETNSRIIYFVVFVLLISGVLSFPLQMLSNAMLSLMDLLTFWIR